jgi:hypothetical protein
MLVYHPFKAKMSRMIYDKYDNLFEAATDG